MRDWLRIAVVVALALVVVPARPGRAGTTTVEFIQAPAPDAGVRGKLSLTVGARSTEALREVTLRLRSNDPALDPPYSQSVVEQYEEDKPVRQVDLAAVWGSNDFDVRNGVYEIVVTASVYPSPSEVAAEGTRLIRVDNPPPPLYRVEAKVSDGVPVVTWCKADMKDPRDLAGYVVERSEQGRAFETIARPRGETSFRDGSAPKGVPLRYRVSALGHSPVDPEGIRSEPAEGKGDVTAEDRPASSDENPSASQELACDRPQSVKPSVGLVKIDSRTSPSPVASVQTDEPANTGPEPAPAPTPATAVQLVEGPAGGGEVRGKVKLAVEARSTEPLRKVVLFLHSKDASVEPPYTRALEERYDERRQARKVRTEAIWDSGDLDIRNGVYEIVVSAFVYPSSESAAAGQTRLILVDNAPEPPEGADVVISQGVPSLTWCPSRAKDRRDFRGYVIERSASGGRFEEVGRTRGEVSFRDLRPPKGAPLRYRVSTLRYSPIDPDGIRSEPAQAGAGKADVMVRDLSASPGGDRARASEQPPCAAPQPPPARQPGAGPAVGLVKIASVTSASDASSPSGSRPQSPPSSGVASTSQRPAADAPSDETDGARSAEPAALPAGGARRSPVGALGAGAGATLAALFALGAFIKRRRRGPLPGGAGYGRGRRRPGR